MAAVRSRRGHYIFALWFLSSLWSNYGRGMDHYIFILWFLLLLLLLLLLLFLA